MACCHIFLSPHLSCPRLYPREGRGGLEIFYIVVYTNTCKHARTCMKSFEPPSPKNVFLATPLFLFLPYPVAQIDHTYTAHPVNLSTCNLLFSPFLYLCLKFWLNIPKTKLRLFAAWTWHHAHTYEIKRKERKHSFSLNCVILLSVC